MSRQTCVTLSAGAYVQLGDSECVCQECLGDRPQMVAEKALENPVASVNIAILVPGYAQVVVGALPSQARAFARILLAEADRADEGGLDHHPLNGSN
jgi:hypothetical protein